MEIKDIHGMYSIRIDKIRRVVYETQCGLWNKSDIERYHNDYVTKVIPLLGNDQPWAICDDLRHYKNSNISDEINEHVDWKLKNNLTKAVMVTTSALVKMQTKISTGSALDPKAFRSIEEADKWLKSEGF